MPYTTVASGGATEFVGLATNTVARANIESQYPEGSEGQLEISVRWVSQGVMEPALSTLDDLITTGGVELIKSSTYDGDAVRVYFRKGFPIVAVLVAALVASAVILAVMVAYKFLRLIGISAEGASLISLLAVAAVGIGAAYMVARGVSKFGTVWRF